MYSIIRNSANCTNCGSSLLSTRPAAPVLCACGNLMIDGGRNYLGRSVRLHAFTETSKYADLACKECLGSGGAALGAACDCVRSANALWGRAPSPIQDGKPGGPVNAYGNGYRDFNARPRCETPRYRSK